jgi:predicted MPP superfamily phosphohydrolase
MYLPSDAWPDALRIYIFGFIFIAFAAKLLPIIFLFLADLFRGFQFVHKKALVLAKGDSNNDAGNKITRSQFLKRAGLVSGGVIFSGLFLGMLKWVFDFKIHRHTVNIPGLPYSFNGFKVVQISDIHLGSWSSKTALKEAIDRINELQPDVIFFTGDLVNDKTDEALPFEQILAKLRAKKGIYATLGNHDYGDYVRWPSKEAKAKNMTDLFDFYSRMGWKLLNNENQVFESHDGKLAVIGVENWGDFGRFPKYGDLQQAMNGAEDANVKLLLSHDPSHWDKVVTRDFQDIDITFSGHTHGFQFGIEIKNIKWSPAQYAYKHWAGLYEKASDKNKTQRLYVNRGLGTIGYPGRVGILPEITLMELKRG